MGNLRYYHRIFMKDGTVNNFKILNLNWKMKPGKLCQSNKLATTESQLKSLAKLN